MTIEAEIIRELHEADLAYKMALAVELAKQEYATLPQDVRSAHANLAVRKEAERLRDANIAAEELRADREERWIAAHEYATAWRREQAS